MLEKERNFFSTRTVLLLLLSFILLRIIFLPSLSLLPEEAYYWKYAQNLDYGYLDHPPMVALTIYAGELIGGTSEFGIRVGAIIWWIITAIFSYKLTKEIFGMPAALSSLLLLASLPYFLGAGFFITPDAPLLSFSAMALYFLYRVLVYGEEKTWLLVGLSLGLGMLSKYPIVLLGIPTLLYMLLIPEARCQFKRPWPYLAALLAILIFLPVVIWNIQNDFASFAFQSKGRIQQGADFSTHEFLLSVLLVLLPPGVFAFFHFLKGQDNDFWTDVNRKTDTRRFVKIFTYAPLIVFFLVSLSREVKVNWTGPVFLAFIPVLAQSLHKGSAALKVVWKWTFITLLCIYIPLLSYLSGFFPFLPYSARLYKVKTGEALAQRVLELQTEVKEDEGVSPVVVGMDKHYLASQLGFYFAKLRGQGFEATEGRELFGRNSLMYEYWSVPDKLIGRSMILISRTKDDLSNPVVLPYVTEADEIRKQIIYENGWETGTYYTRVIKGYKGKVNGKG